ncbi:hypothetical protein AO057_04525 [Curvibacter sp. PAE-UM]|nr:hypothetical protein AO057_04525 [Curvibacter sp. PAE-UM]
MLRSDRMAQWFNSHSRARSSLIAFFLRPSLLWRLQVSRISFSMKMMIATRAVAGRSDESVCMWSALT